MRKLVLAALAALAALFATGAAVAATAPAQAGDSTTCAGTISISSLAWNPPQVRRGQGSALTLVVRNCTGQPLSGTLAHSLRWITPTYEQGCGPVYDPPPPMPVTITAPTWTNTMRFSTLPTCNATGLRVSVAVSAGSTSVGASAVLVITP